MNVSQLKFCEDTTPHNLVPRTFTSSQGKGPGNEVAHLSRRLFWKAAQHLKGKHFSTFVPQENFFVIRKRFKRKTSLYARI